MLRASLVAALFSCSLCDWDTFPVKSINLNAAPSIEFYEREMLAQLGVFDPHAVAGIAASDGSYILVGKGLESESSSSREAFAAKLSASGQAPSPPLAHVHAVLLMRPCARFLAVRLGLEVLCDR